MAAAVAPDGTALFTTTNGPAPADIKVSAASYTGLWKGQTEPQQLFEVVRGTIAAGTSGLTLHVKVPACDPYQVDTFLGWQVPATITYPTGSGTNGLKGQSYANVQTCPTSSPSPSVSPSTAPAPPSPTSPAVSPTSTPPGPSARVLGEQLVAGSTLPATGSADFGLVLGTGFALVLVGGALVGGTALLPARGSRRRNRVR